MGKGGRGKAEDGRRKAEGKKCFELVAIASLHASTVYTQVEPILPNPP
jgi:hypothetical protein